MADEIILGPDVFVNASVAMGSAPDHVTRRVLGGDGPAKTSAWILARIESMLSNIDSFLPERVDEQMALIKKITKVHDEAEHDPGDWKRALIAAAKAAKVKRVITDHPDLIELDSADGIEFMSTDAWLVEVTTPPPPPGT